MTMVCSSLILQEPSRLGFVWEKEDFGGKGVLQRSTMEVCRAKYGLEVLDSNSSALLAEEWGATK